MNLITDNNMGSDGDHIYNALLDSHKGLSAEQSHRLNARLVLILMNQVGDTQIIEAAIGLAKQGLSNDASIDQGQQADLENR